ncbi:MAG: hypothetical protein ACP5E5_00425 [Acidobacteriaceae bacterium]
MQRTASAAPASAGGTLLLSTQKALFRIDATGSLVSIRCQGREFLAPGQVAPILSVRIADVLHPANRAQWNTQQTRLTLEFSGIDAKATVALHAKPSHIALELIELQASAPVDLIVWGPYPTSIGDLIGEVVGVVRDPEVAVGIQALNVKTLGGYPNQESDIAPDGVTADDHGVYPGLPAALRENQNWRGDTAKVTSYGSSLQAYCRNRDHLRVVSNWGRPQFDALPFADGGVIGSRIALFAVPSADALATLGAIEVAEGLPHPMLHGVWAKQSFDATSSYLIADFGEQTIDQAIAMTKRAGLKVVYQSSPFLTWGHFRLKPALFPNGWDGFRNCVAKARAAGLGVGFHTLSNFITPNDPYVTPKPDPRLARIGATPLAAAINASQTEIPIVHPEIFRQKTELQTVMIGEELVRYADVSESAPWRLLQCRRGAWGTHPAAHAKGAEAALLMDHPYKVFLTSAALSVEVAQRIAAFCNWTDSMQLSLDGLEGNWSTGMGQYGCSLFTDAWYKALKPGLRGQIINDASMPKHYTWHIATRYNWGEPWHGSFRESQTLLRLHNQLFYTRNLIPRMLGWFSIRKDTTPRDLEWLCARAAGFDAGFCVVVSAASMAEQASGALPPLDERLGAMLDIVRVWETARMSQAFPASIKPALQDVTRTFRLSETGPDAWALQPIDPEGEPLQLTARRTPPANLLPEEG